MQSTVVARWQSALPMKEAFVRLKYGSAAATSPEAKQTLDREETSYVIVLVGPLQPLVLGSNPETLKKALMDASSLSAKDKQGVKPSEVEVTPAKKAVEVAFHFPRSAAFGLADKDVEFSTKISGVELKCKFRLKDMVYNGKLEL